MSNFEKRNLWSGHLMWPGGVTFGVIGSLFFFGNVSNCWLNSYGKPFFRYLRKTWGGLISAPRPCAGYIRYVTRDLVKLKLMELVKKLAIFILLLQNPCKSDKRKKHVYMYHKNVVSSTTKCILSIEAFGTPSHICLPILRMWPGKLPVPHKLRWCSVFQCYRAPLSLYEEVLTHICPHSALPSHSLPSDPWKRICVKVHPKTTDHNISSINTDNYLLCR